MRGKREKFKMDKHKRRVGVMIHTKLSSIGKFIMLAGFLTSPIWLFLGDWRDKVLMLVLLPLGLCLWLFKKEKVLMTKEEHQRYELQKIIGV